MTTSQDRADEFLAQWQAQRHLSPSKRVLGSGEVVQRLAEDSVPDCPPSYERLMAQLRICWELS